MRTILHEELILVLKTGQNLMVGRLLVPGRTYYYFLLNGPGVKLLSKYLCVYIHPKVSECFLVRDACLCNGRQLIQRFITGQHAEIDCWMLSPKWDSSIIP